MAEGQTIDILVRQAMKGQRDALGQLARSVEGRVSAYLCRVTLSRALTEDLTQEVLLTMVSSLGDLKDPDRFWPWLYRIAQSKVQQHFREKQRHPVAPESRLYEELVARRADRHQHDGLKQLMHKDLVKKTLAAMRQLSEPHRAVLSLRCFDQLSYGDIALTMNCSEVKARVLFYRAKEALKKQLGRHGIKKGMLVMCLGLFGKITAPADAAPATVTVAAGSMKAGLTAALLANLTIKTVVLIVGAITLGTATVGTVSSLSQPALTPRQQVTSLHFTTQLRFTDPGPSSSLSKGAYEQWFHFPDGVDGPVFFRMQRWDPQQKDRLCAWLQDGEANYYFESGTKKLYLSNDRVYWSCLKVRRLPTDDAEFTGFLTTVEGRDPKLTYQRDRRSGLLLGALDDRFADARRFRTTYEYNTVGPNAFEPNWPVGAPVVDKRDEMHRRGWTFFTVQGRLADHTVSGRGRVPFVYNRAREHPAWMTLEAGPTRIIDRPEVARVENTDDGTAIFYPGGSFFAGLARPWMGLHCVDTVRRDAVEQRIAFETNKAKRGGLATVTLTHAIGPTIIGLSYLLDMDNDVIDEIRFAINRRPAGVLRFSYLQEIEAVAQSFVEPDPPQELSTPVSEGPGLMWLIDLALGQLGQQ
ncbi:MAG: RNA polymerase sigma factor [Sedimentisphaerales bacterium]|nr:RNA polymerase sigma factor [Sedimentisphaerales bacterium]